MCAEAGGGVAEVPQVSRKSSKRRDQSLSLYGAVDSVRKRSDGAQCPLPTNTERTMTKLKTYRRSLLLMMLVAAEALALNAVATNAATAASNVGIPCENLRCLSLSPYAGCTYNQGTNCANGYGQIPGQPCDTQSCIPK